MEEQECFAVPQIVGLVCVVLGWRNACLACALRIGEDRCNFRKVNYAGAIHRHDSDRDDIRPQLVEQWFAVDMKDMLKAQEEDAQFVPDDWQDEYWDDPFERYQDEAWSVYHEFCSVDAHNRKLGDTCWDSWDTL